MARVTVEDCVLKIPDRFELVMIAAQRAREIAAGGALGVERDNDKNPVVALREIAEERVSLEDLRSSLVRGHQRSADVDEPEPDIVELIAAEQSLVPGDLEVGGLHETDVNDEEEEQAGDIEDDLPIEDPDALLG